MDIGTSSRDVNFRPFATRRDRYIHPRESRLYKTRNDRPYRYVGGFGMWSAQKVRWIGEAASSRNVFWFADINDCGGCAE